jgi:hypothetical protein
MCKTVEVIEVIKVVTTEGSGTTKEDPIKEVIQYWSKDGKLLFKLCK